MQNKRQLLVAAAFFVLGLALAINLLTFEPGQFSADYLWGREGKLAMDLSLERTAVHVTERLNYTMTLTNVGTRPVRVYVGYFGIGSRLLDENNQTPSYHGPMMAPPARPDDEKFNAMMKVIEPGQNITQTGHFANYTVGGGHHDLWPNMTYHIIAEYSCSEDRPYPALPHWLGEVRAEPKYFTVRG